MRTVEINKLVAIKNYAAGQNGAMLVALDENLSIEGQYGKKGDKSINLLICTAEVAPADAVSLRKYTDGISPTTRIVLVSKKFLRLRNTTQLALLEIQNSAMQVQNPETNETRRMYGEYCAIERFGKIAVCLARHKEQQVKYKSLNKATKGVHRAHVKQLREDRKSAAGSVFDLFKLFDGKETYDDIGDLDDLFEDLEDDVEIVNATVEPAPANA